MAAFLTDFIEAGFDILNPVQTSAAGMDPRGLKENYGDRLTFWGGGVDTQNTLPFGTPEQIGAEVRQRMDIFGRGGGFIFNTDPQRAGTRTCGEFNCFVPGSEIISVPIQCEILLQWANPLTLW